MSSLTVGGELLKLSGRPSQSRIWRVGEAPPAPLRKTASLGILELEIVVIRGSVNERRESVQCLGQNATYYSGDEPIPGYRLISFLGRGNFGEVWKASAPGGMEVAMKIIDLSVRGGMKEFGSLQRMKHIHHPNLVPVFASWLITEDGQTITDFPGDMDAAALRASSADAIAQLSGLAGQKPSRPTDLLMAMGLGVASLASRLEDCLNDGKSGIPREELLDYMEGAAKGIDYLNQPIHDLGEGPDSIIHGDIKPHNILIVGNAVQVCDFGLARAVESLRRTSTGTGTFAYAAPELLEGMPNRASDQYCLAVSYVELCTGDLPFDETNPLKVVERHRNGDLDFSRLGIRESEIIKRATAVDPKLRWPSCTAMVRALQRACEADQVTSSAELQAGGATAKGSAGPASSSARFPKGTAYPPSVKRHDSSQTPAVRSVVETVASGTLPKLQPPPLPRAKRRIAIWALVGLLLIAGSVAGAFVAYDWHCKSKIGTLIDVAKIDDAFEFAERCDNERLGRMVVWTPSYVVWTRNRLENHVVELARNGEYHEAVDELNKAPPSYLNREQRRAVHGKIKETWHNNIVNCLNTQKRFPDAVKAWQSGAAALPDNADSELKDLLASWLSYVAELGKCDEQQFVQSIKEWEEAGPAIQRASNAARKAYPEIGEQLRAGWTLRIRNLSANRKSAEALNLFENGHSEWLKDERGKALCNEAINGLASGPNPDFREAFRLVKNIASADSDGSIRANLVASWRQYIDQRAAENSFKEACAAAREAPPDESRAQLDALRGPWRESARQSAGEGKFDQAYEVWEQADPSWAADQGPLLADLQKILGTAFEKEAKSSCAKALDLYANAPAKLRSPSLEAARRRLFDTWLESVGRERDNEKTLADCEVFRKSYPQHISEVNLVSARAYLRTRRTQACLQQLKKAEAGLPQGARPLRLALGALADGDGRKKEKKPEVRQRLDDYQRIAKLAVAPWKLDNREELEIARLDAWCKSGRTAPEKSFGQWIVEIENLRDKADFQNAKRALEAAERLVANDPHRRSRVEQWRTVLNLEDPKTPFDDLLAAVKNADSLMKSNQLTSDDLDRLCGDLGRLRPTGDERDKGLLDEAMNLLRHGVDGELVVKQSAAKQLRLLWPERIKISLTDKTPNPWRNSASSRPTRSGLACKTSRIPTVSWKSGRLSVSWNQNRRAPRNRAAYRRWRFPRVATHIETTWPRCGEREAYCN